MSSEWKQILNTHYSVSDDGKVRNDKSNRILKRVLSGGGYVVALSINGKQKIRRASRLVAEAFVEQPEGKTRVWLKDRNKKNCAASNIQWVTPREITMMTMPKNHQQGAKHSQSKLTEAKVRKIRRRLATGESVRDVAKDFPMVAVGTIKRLKYTKTYWRGVQ